MNILVGYASAHGSTAEIGEFIGQELKGRDFNVTVANVADVKSIDSYDAFVLGSAIHDGMWLTEMSQFLSRFEAALAEKPVAFFVTCIRIIEDDGYQHVIENYINHKVLDKLNLKSVTAFAGRLEFEAVDWDERWALAARYDGRQVPGTLNEDFRDWDEIRSWTQHIADDLLSR